MKDICVDLLQIRDSSFEIGVRTGRVIQNQPIVQTFKSITKPEIDYDNMKSIYSSFAPHLLEELDGLAHSINLPTSKAAALFSGYDVPRTEAMGCSALLTKDYYVRNYDFSPAFYDGIFSLLQPEKFLASAGYNLQILGRHDGVNEQGLVIGLHFVSNDGYRKGVSPWISVRMVLDMCSSVEEATSMLKEIPHAACYNFSLGDSRGNMAVVEASPENIMVRRDDFLTCVNHFQDDDLKDKNRNIIDGSLERNSYLHNLRETNLTQEEAFNEFKSKQSPLFFTDYDNLFGTLHTFSYSYQDSKILTAIAQSSQTLEVDFKEWVQGKNINVQRLKGSLEN
ncbi:C45 family autoproteolytic acyltransferase/hydolase [Salimicrobium halophilum]|uniref:Predicted choloylglycine hydrolase n=1 Tax=Salimicrobium halophilum TaxID=86666 RepID=A0A1G8RIK4_9BACI|nr:C45 family peptidase [Salimicrobium halophilum]SDJ16345.1 Predicted choloylglycine hydrolase [Salimicrobium halophilum]